jgi:hypothetical protein
MMPRFKNGTYLKFCKNNGYNPKIIKIEDNNGTHYLTTLIGVDKKHMSASLYLSMYNSPHEWMLYLDLNSYNTWLQSSDKGHIWKIPHYLQDQNEEAYIKKFMRIVPIEEIDDSFFVEVDEERTAINKFKNTLDKLLL